MIVCVLIWLGAIFGAWQYKKTMRCFTDDAEQRVVAQSKEYSLPGMICDKKRKDTT